MIISVRGTNGAGKSHLVRRITNLYPASAPHFYPKAMRKRTVAGVTYIRLIGPALFVPGHYEEGVNGGLDTMPKEGKLEFAYTMIRGHHMIGEDVLCEGRNREDGIDQLLSLHRAGWDARVVFLNLPPDECIAAVRARPVRGRSGGSKMKEEGVYELYRKMLKQYDAFVAAGVRCVVLDREMAYKKVRTWLRLPERCE